MATDFNQEIGGWNTSSVTNMNQMFFGSVSFNQDISSWDTSSVINMNQMFFRSVSFNQDISNWCVEQVTNNFQFDTYSAFEGQTNLQPVWGTQCN